MWVEVLLSVHRIISMKDFDIPRSALPEKIVIFKARFGFGERSKHHHFVFCSFVLDEKLQGRYLPVQVHPIVAGNARSKVEFLPLIHRDEFKRDRMLIQSLDVKLGFPYRMRSLFQFTFKIHFILLLLIITQIEIRRHLM